MTRIKCEGKKIEGVDAEFKKKRKNKKKKMTVDTKLEICLVHMLFHCVRGPRTFKTLLRKIAFSGRTTPHIRAVYATSFFFNNTQNILITIILLSNIQI
jgi:hypothetical protein